MDSELSKKIEGVFLGRKRVNLTLKVAHQNDPTPIVIEDDQPFLPKNHRKRKPVNPDMPSTSSTIVLSSGDSDDETDRQDLKAEDAELQYLLQLQKQFEEEDEKENLERSIREDKDYELAIQLAGGQSSSQENLLSSLKSLVSEDEKLARELQASFVLSPQALPLQSPKGKLFHKPQTFFTDKHLSTNVYASMAPHLNNRLCDHEWEAMDPNPNIHELFQYFSERFFWGSLGIVQLEWSKRMYSCAGICYYERRRNAESCIIRLSEPLLKLRSRGDLVNTLIHEMIHAFLFVTHDDRDRDGHGPRFQAHGARINGEAKTNITIYHDWHDESNYYKQHVWRCNGPCKDRKPFYGWIRRTANRKPGKNDRWWAQHQATCNGEFIKVSEPEKKKKENTKKRKGSESLNSTTNTKKTRPDSNQPSILDLIGPAPPIRNADSAFERPREKRPKPRESTISRDNKKKQPKLSDFWSSASEESSHD